MPLAPRSSLNSAKMQTKLSAWTPLNHQLSNSNVFVERRKLLAKWFDKWSDSQRKAVLQDFVTCCGAEQLRFLSLSVSRRLPLQAADFTCLLPRVLCLYVFSFLDPRSLSRCAQVSWHWRSIVELDQLWMPKCLKLGWCITFSPTPFEQGVWKRHYIQTVQELRVAKPQVCVHIQTLLSQQQFSVPDVITACSTSADTPEAFLVREVRSAPACRRAGSASERGLRAGRQPTAPPPWRDSDRHPKDTLRFNYLANLDPIEQALQAQTKSRAPSNKATPDDARSKTLSEANYKLRKAKSLMFLSSNSRPHPPPPPAPPPPPPLHPQNQSRPDWAARVQDYRVTKEAAKNLARSAQWNAGIRPGPVRPAVPRLSQEGLRAARRSCRSAPSTPLFDFQPWTVPASNHTGDKE